VICSVFGILLINKGIIHILQIGHQFSARACQLFICHIWLKDMLLFSVIGFLYNENGRLLAKK